MTHQIECGLFKRKGKAVTNFKATLPAPQSDLAKQTLKDPYNFDFLTIREKHDEKELENALVEQIIKFKSAIPSIEEIEAELENLE